MSKSFDSFQKRRLQSSYISIVVSISLVLFMMGFLGLVLLKSTKVANHFKEKVVMTLFLNDNVTKKQRENFSLSLEKESYINKTIYVSKETAAEIYKEDLGEDFLEFLGDNPLKNGIDVYLKADFVTPEKMEDIKKSFDENDFVAEVNYDRPLVKLLTENIKRISFWLLILSIFFGLIVILLINSSIRLSIYSKRFNIKTMQMVGATKSFIRKPFILQSVKLGFIGCFISLCALTIMMYYIDKNIPTLELFTDYGSLFYMAVGILTTAFCITYISTFFATQRFLNLQTNDLYY